VIIVSIRTGIRTASSGHEEIGVSPDLPIFEIGDDSSSGHLVGNGITSVALNTLDGPSLLFGGEESTLLGEVDNQEKSGDTETNGDDTEKHEDLVVRSCRMRFG